MPDRSRTPGPETALTCSGAVAGVQGPSGLPGIPGPPGPPGPGYTGPRPETVSASSDNVTSLTATARCLPDEIAIGGGGIVQGRLDSVISSVEPVIEAGRPVGWRATGSQGAPDLMTVTVTTLCVRPVNQPLSEAAGGENDV